MITRVCFNRRNVDRTKVAGELHHHGRSHLKGAMCESCKKGRHQCTSIHCACSRCNIIQ